MRIIKADPTHLEQIMEVWKEFAEYHQEIDAYYGTIEGGQTLFGEYMRGMLGHEDSNISVAIEGERLMGYCLAVVHPRAPMFTEKAVGIISDLAVRSEYRGGGVGRALMDVSLAWLREKGMKRVELRTSSKNLSSIEFYKKQGFGVYDHIMTREI